MILSLWSICSCSRAPKINYKEQYDTLSVSYDELLRKNKDLEAKIEGLEYRVSFWKTEYYAQKLFADDVRGRYLTLYSWALAAEYQLENEGIVFSNIVGPLEPED